MPRTLRSLALVLLAGVVAGCAVGGGEERLSKEEYEELVQRVYADVQQAFQGTRGAAGEELAGRIVLAQEALRYAADRLSAEQPPEEVEVHNADLVEGMREYADALDEAVRAASRGDAAALEAFGNVSQNPGVREMAEAAEEMKQNGYDLGPIAQE